MRIAPFGEGLDTVFVRDAISYVTTEDRFEMETGDIPASEYVKEWIIGGEIVVTSNSFGPNANISSMFPYVLTL